jgi:hypothetical protein
MCRPKKSNVLMISVGAIRITSTKQVWKNSGGYLQSTEDLFFHAVHIEVANHNTGLLNNTTMLRVQLVDVTKVFYV